MKEYENPYMVTSSVSYKDTERLTSDSEDEQLSLALQHPPLAHNHHSLASIPIRISDHNLLQHHRLEDQEAVHSILALNSASLHAASLAVGTGTSSSGTIPVTARSSDSHLSMATTTSSISPPTSSRRSNKGVKKRDRSMLDGIGRIPGGESTRQLGFVSTLPTSLLSAFPTPQPLNMIQLEEQKPRKKKAKVSKAKVPTVLAVSSAAMDAADNSSIQSDESPPLHRQSPTMSASWQVVVPSTSAEGERYADPAIETEAAGTSSPIVSASSSPTFPAPVPSSKVSPSSGDFVSHQLGNSVEVFQTMSNALQTHSLPTFLPNNTHQPPPQQQAQSQQQPPQQAYVPQIQILSQSQAMEMTSIMNLNALSNHPPPPPPPPQQFAFPQQHQQQQPQNIAGMNQILNFAQPTAIPLGSNGNNPNTAMAIPLQAFPGLVNAYGNNFNNGFGSSLALISHNGQTFLANIPSNMFATNNTFNPHQLLPQSLQVTPLAISQLPSNASIPQQPQQQLQHHQQQQQYQQLPSQPPSHQHQSSKPPSRQAYQHSAEYEAQYTQAIQVQAYAQAKAEMQAMVYAEQQQAAYSAQVQHAEAQEKVVQIQAKFHSQYPSQPMPSSNASTAASSSSSSSMSFARNGMIIQHPNMLPSSSSSSDYVYPPVNPANNMQKSSSHNNLPNIQPSSTPVSINMHKKGTEQLANAAMNPDGKSSLKANQSNEEMPDGLMLTFLSIEDLLGYKMDISTKAKHLAHHIVTIPKENLHYLLEIAGGTDHTTGKAFYTNRTKLFYGYILQITKLFLARDTEPILKTILHIVEITNYDEHLLKTLMRHEVHHLLLSRALMTNEQWKSKTYLEKAYRLLLIFLERSNEAFEDLVVRRAIHQYDFAGTVLEMVKHHIEHYRRTIIVSAINIIHHIMVMKQQIYVFSTADVQMTLRWAMEKLGHEKRVLEEGTRIKIQQLLDL